MASFTIYLKNDNGVDIYAIVKSSKGELWVHVPAGKTVAAPKGSSGLKFLLSMYESQPNGDLEPVQAVIIDAIDGHVYEVATNGVPVAKAELFSGTMLPTADKATAESGECRF